jgi:N-acetylmuramoyl-L-alanine amidase
VACSGRIPNLALAQEQIVAFHEVKQGEHLSGIAADYGFPDFTTIWNRAENADLKQKRENPHVLLPGDKVFVPDKIVKEYSRPADNQHEFELLTKPLFLKLELRREYDDPIANTPCDLIVEADTFALTSDGKGKLQRQISKKARGASLRIKDKLEFHDNQIPFERLIAIRIGDLDPVDETSGQAARLANLGYYRGPIDKVDPDEFQSAVEEFQCENGLTVDGKIGPQTQGKLKTVHGC